MREEVNERRRTAYPGGREIEITIGGAVADDDFDRINGDDAPKTPGGIYSRETLRWKRESFTQEDAAYTRQLLRDAQESGYEPGEGAVPKREAKSKNWHASVSELGKKFRQAIGGIKKLSAKKAADPEAAESAAAEEVRQEEMSDSTAEAVPASVAAAPGEKQAETAENAQETERKPENGSESTKNNWLRYAVITAAAAVILLAVITAIMLPVDEQTPGTPAVSRTDIKVVSLSDSVPGFALETYNCNFILPEDGQVIEIADGLMGDRLFVRHTMAAESYDIAAIDWNIQAKDSPNTYQLYLQALNPVVYLVRAYELTGDNAYLDRAEQFILSWDEYQRDLAKSSSNSMLWNDHGTAIRAENLMYFYLVSRDAGWLSDSTGQYIINMLSRHAEFLYDDANYTENHNHGIFQDRALIYIACFLNDGNFDRWMSRAKTRLEEQKAYAYTSEMIHVENSPHYHNDVTETLRTAAQFLMCVGDAYGGELYASLERSEEYLAYILKPNGHLAETGDTDSSAESAADTVKEYWAQHREETRFYGILSRIYGDAEYNIASESAFYPESGYYVYRGEWERQGSEQSTWMMFRSGYSSGTHKHADDNSFMLYTAGYDVFVDPGYYNYMQGDRYSDYFASSAAHNTVIVDGGSYSTTAENSHLTGIYTHTNGENYDYVLGVNDMYAGVSHDRHFYNFGGAIIIYDDIRSYESHTYSQLFHLGETAEIISQTDSEVLITLTETDTFVRVRQLGAPCELSVVNGADEGAQYGYISRSLNHIDAIDTLKFDQTGEDVSFITIITIENSRGRIDGIRDIEFSDGVFTVKPSLFEDKYTVALQPRERADASAVTVMQESRNTFVFTNQNRLSGLEFAWEIIRKTDGSTVYFSEYSPENVLRYEFTGAGEYLVRAYVRDGVLERRAVVAVIRCDADVCTDITAQYPYLELMYRGHSYTDSGNGGYSFAVDFDYSHSYSIRWYIYKNGAYYDTVTTTSSTLDYTFTQPGKYTVIYYLRTDSGSNEMWNYPEITVG